MSVRPVGADLLDPPPEYRETKMNNAEIERENGADVAATTVLTGLPLAAVILLAGTGGALAGPRTLPEVSLLPGGAPVVLAEAHSEAEPAGELPPAADLTETHVVVKAPDSVGETDLSLLSTVVSEAGFVDPEVERSGVTTTDNHIRFYYPEDIAAAATLAGITGAEIRDFTEFEPRPEIRVVELWLQGESETAAPAPAPTQRKTTKKKVWRPAKAVDRVLDKVFGGN